MMKMRMHYPTLLGVLWLALVQVFGRLYLKTDPKVEDDFVSHFGNNSTERNWPSVRNAHSRGADGEKRLKKFCAQAHKMAGKGSITVNSILIRPRKLVFKNDSYLHRRVDVLSYEMDNVNSLEYDKNYWYMTEGDHTYITQGKTANCVYYLSLLNSFTMKFSLVKHVCGIKVNLDKTIA